MNPSLKVAMQRPGAFLEMAMRSLQPDSNLCPSCGGVAAEGVLDRRFGIMSLRRCSACHLQFRTPTETPAKSRSFYQNDYTETTVTDVPSLQELELLKADGFSSKGNLTPYVDLIRRIIPDRQPKIVDYGCSWGYNTWRFQNAGFIASGVEVSRPRCDFGKNHLNLDVHYEAKELTPPYDVFFSSHVFEHVPSVQTSFEEAKILLRLEGGLLIVITPNGSADFREKNPTRWHELWGRKHPAFLDEQLWKNLLQPFPHVILSRSEDGSVVAPLNQLTREALSENRPFDLSGEELIAVAWLSDK